MHFILAKDADRSWLPCISADVQLPDNSCASLTRKELKQVSEYLSRLFEFSVSVVRLSDNTTVVLRMGEPKPPTGLPGPL